MSDWIEFQVRAGRPMYVFSQAHPHEAFIKIAAERSITLRSYMDVPILDLTAQDHADEAAMRQKASF